MKTINILAISAAIVLTASLSACTGGGNESSNSTQSKTPVGAKSDANSNSLEIVGFGPQSMKVGAPAFVQTNKKSAMWVRVNHSLEGSDAAIYLDGQRLQSTPAGTLITAFVPPAAYAKPGKHSLHVVESRKTGTMQSKDVELVVE